MEYSGIITPIRGDITPVIRPFIGVITLLITSRDPPCRERTLFADPELRYFFRRERLWNYEAPCHGKGDLSVVYLERWFRTVVIGLCLSHSNSLMMMMMMIPPDGPVSTSFKTFPWSYGFAALLLVSLCCLCYWKLLQIIVVSYQHSHPERCMRSWCSSLPLHEKGFWYSWYLIPPVPDPSLPSEVRHDLSRFHGIRKACVLVDRQFPFLCESSRSKKRHGRWSHH